MVTPSTKTNRRRPSVSSAAMVSRLEDLERYARQHGESITVLTDALGTHDIRIKSLEELAHLRAITEAREDERDKNLYDRLDRMEMKISSVEGSGENTLEKRLLSLTNTINTINEDVKSLKGNRTWIVMAIVGAVLTALITLVLNGGTAG